MRKNCILLGLLAIGFANAQQGNVGINTDDPKATIQIDVANANLTDETLKTSNQGIIIPKLTKQRIADITEGDLVDGTMLYAYDFTDITQTNETIKRRVAQITTKDFYKYNTERDLWERMSSKRLTKEIKQDYTLSEADYHYYLYVKSASEIKITIPNNLKDGFTCIIIQEGEGKAVIEGNAQGANGLKTKSQNSAIGVIVRNNTAIVTGDTAN